MSRHVPLALPAAQGLEPPVANTPGHLKADLTLEVKARVGRVV